MPRGVFTLFVIGSAGCQVAPFPSTDVFADSSVDATSDGPGEGEDATVPLHGELRRPAPTTVEVIAQAQQILRENPHAQEGSEFPFTLGARRYVARVERHNNPDGDPARPPGEHKGITVYVVDP